MRLVCYLLPAAAPLLQIYLCFLPLEFSVLHYLQRSLLFLWGTSACDPAILGSLIGCTFNLKGKWDQYRIKGMSKSAVLDILQFYYLLLTSNNNQMGRSFKCWMVNRGPGLNDWVLCPNKGLFLYTFKTASLRQLWKWWQQSSVCMLWLLAQKFPKLHTVGFQLHQHAFVPVEVWSLIGC